MRTIKIDKGRNIPLKGTARRELKQFALPGEVFFPFFEFRPQQLRLLVKEGDQVLLGASVAEDRNDPRVRVVSPVSGKISSIIRGEKRMLLALAIATDGKQEPVRMQEASAETLASLSRDELVARILNAGLWPFIRQRPFSKVANPAQTPKSIFVRVMNTDPLAPDMDMVLEGQEAEFQTGLDVLRLLTSGKVFVCCGQNSKVAALKDVRGAEIVAFSGPHPAGNVGTHIHYLDPIGKGEVVWFMESEDVIRLARTLSSGVFDPAKTVAVTGEGAANRLYARTVLGAPMAFLLGEPKKEGCRYISGSILSGQEVGFEGSVGLYHNQVTVIPAGGKRMFFGWAMPNFEGYTFTRMLGGGFIPRSEVSLDTEIHGGFRAVVVNDLYDELVTLDVMTYFMIKAIWAGQIEEMMSLGILECAPEDFALATFACPSKVDVGAIIQRGLDMIEKEV